MRRDLLLHVQPIEVRTSTGKLSYLNHLGGAEDRRRWHDPRTFCRRERGVREVCMLADEHACEAADVRVLTFLDGHHAGRDLEYVPSAAVEEKGLRIGTGGRLVGNWKFSCSRG